MPDCFYAKADYVYQCSVCKDTVITNEKPAQVDGKLYCSQVCLDIAYEIGRFEDDGNPNHP